MIVEIIQITNCCSLSLLFFRLFSTPEIVSEVKQTPPVSNGKTSLKQTNLVDVEVHHNGNGLNGNNHLLVDEDEGEGKSLDEDLLLDKSEDNLEKSNGTPTSGIVDDEDDSFSDPTNDLNTISSSNEHSKQTEIKHIETVKHHHPFNEIVKPNKRWNNLNETTEIKTPVLASNHDESANDSLIDNSLNLTSDITVDSIKEHFNNLSLRNDVDLFDKDGKLNFDSLFIHFNSLFINFDSHFNLDFTFN